MAAARLIVSAVTLAITAARHPLVRAGVAAAAPVILNPKNRQVAIGLTRTAAYNAGALVRRVTPKQFLDR